MWLITLQRALNPQEPGHGSRHDCLMQAWLLGHSALIRHSGWQFGGDPMNWLKHVQEGIPFEFLHSELGPQGDGMHGSIGAWGFSGGSGAVGKRDHYKMYQNDVAKNAWLCLNDAITWYRITLGERVTSESRLTRTNWTVSYNSTNCVRTANAQARINALLIDACFIDRTFGAHHAFRSTVGGTSDICLQARAYRLTMYFSTLAIWSARTRLAWIYDRNFGS